MPAPLGPPPSPPQEVPTHRIPALCGQTLGHVPLSLPEALLGCGVCGHQANGDLSSLRTAQAPEPVVIPIAWTGRLGLRKAMVPVQSPQLQEAEVGEDCLSQRHLGSGPRIRGWGLEPKSLGRKQRGGGHRPPCCDPCGTVPLCCSRFWATLRGPRWPKVALPAPRLSWSSPTRVLPLQRH